ncbi:MAG: hypothetical protein KC621_04055 [Myxococcales bacterium]|nr:hypothetical protein [Myxococcales bacterium]
MNEIRTLLASTALFAGVVGCTAGAGATGTSSSALTLTGRVEQTGFESPATTVRATRAGSPAVEAPIASEGSFSIALPAGVGYSVDFLSANKASALVFPRSSGKIGRGFDVSGSGAFDLGVVRRIGDPAQHQFRFVSAGAALSNDAGTPSDGDGECEDGIDPSTGAVCVDEDAATDGACERQDGDVESADDSGADVEADDDTESDDDGAAATDAVVADHNLPSSVRCPDAAGDPDNVECEDGIDPATGAECDGGPSANQDDGTGG